VKRKKRKLGYSSQIDQGSHPSSSIGGPFAMLSEEMRHIHDLVVGLPHGLRDTSEGPFVCISKK